MESCSVKDGLALKYGVCQVFAGFGYITFDGVVLPHHGACTYVVSALSSKALHDYSLLLSFKDNKGIFTISKVVFNLPSLEVSIDPESLWKVKVSSVNYTFVQDKKKISAALTGVCAFR